MHHSAVDVNSTAEEIADYHVNVMKWPAIGYHFRIGWQGDIDYVGELQTARANVYKRNPEVVGICLPGDWTDRLPPEPALHSLNVLMRYLLHLLPWAKPTTHRDVALPESPTSCPGNALAEWVRGRG